MLHREVLTFRGTLCGKRRDAAKCEYLHTSSRPYCACRVKWSQCNDSERCRRRVLKALLKGGDATSLSVDDNGEQNILQRSVPANVVSQYVEKIAGLEGDIEEMMVQERRTNNWIRQ